MVTRSRFILIILTVALAAVSMIVLVQSVDVAEIPISAQEESGLLGSTGTAISSPSATSSSAFIPSRLLIPDIHLDARIRPVGVTAHNTLATPGNFTDVGWYRGGAVPGQKGISIIDGHVDNGLGLAAVFANLSSLKSGQSIYVVGTNGSRVHFIVNRLETVDYTQPADAFFDQNQNRPLLELITCSGTWIPTLKTYDRRLIVTAVLAP